MNKKDLIKEIVESLEKGLVENLEYDFPNINISTGYVVETTAKGVVSIVRKDYKIKIDFVGMIRKD